MTTLVSRSINTFTGCSEVQNHYTAWFDTDKGILHHVSSKAKNALAINENPYGYLHCQSLTLDGKKKTVKIHRIVCEFFHGAPTEEKNEVNHKNHNRSDNRASNLEWTDHYGNNQGDPLWVEASTKAIKEANSHPIEVHIHSIHQTLSFESCAAANKYFGYTHARAGINAKGRLSSLFDGTDSTPVTFYSNKANSKLTISLPK